MTIREWKWRIPGKPGHQARVAAIFILVLASTAKGNESASMKKSMIRACQIPSLDMSSFYEGGEKTVKEMKSFIEMEYKTLSALNRTNANPHLVALVLDGEQFCSGTLISESFVLTSAHCTNNVKKIDMIFGTEDMTMEDAGVQKRTEYSTAVYEHPAYDKTSGSNDISLIRLSKPIFITKFVKAARIPDLSQLDASLDGLDAEIAGWSESNLEGGKVYSESNSKKVRIASNSVCRSIHNSVNDQKMMCSKDVTRNELCQADSGSPVTTRCDMSVFKIGHRTTGEVMEGGDDDDVLGDEGRCEFFDNCEEVNEDPLEGLEDDSDLDDYDDDFEVECKTEDEDCKSKKMAMRRKIAITRAQRRRDNKLSRNVHKLCKNCKRKDPENFCFLFYHFSALQNATNAMSKADSPRPPGSRPNRPGSRPNKPASGNRPNKPSNRPNRPSQRPNKPGQSNRPNKPAQRPNRPGSQNRPNKPSQKPVTLAKRPSKPGQSNRPNKPANRPNKPGQSNRPNKPANRPNKPSNRPNKPSGKPNKPAQKPAGSRNPVTTAPAAPSTPVETPQLLSKQRPNKPSSQGRPNKPGQSNRPNKPGSRPNKPGSRPNKPGNRPNKPANRPQKPSGKPNNPAQKPLLQACDAFNRSPHVLLGITSFGSCSDGLVFTKITPYMDFIKSTLALKY